MLEGRLDRGGLKVFQQMLKNEKALVVEGLWDVPKAILASLAQKVTGKHILIVTGRSKEEIRLFDDCSLLYNGVLDDFPAWETLPSENIPPSPDITGDRYRVLKKILERDESCILLSSVQACLQRLISPEKLKKMFLSLHVGNELPFSDFIIHLAKIGYQRKAVATDKGEFAVRGGIIDVFPVGSPAPVRLEFWGDEISSMRLYDPVGQRSVEEIVAIEITPAQEMEFLREEKTLSTIIDYLGENTLVIFDDIAAIEDRYVMLEEIPGVVSKTFSSFHQFFDSIDSLQRIYWPQTEIESLSSVCIKKEQDDSESLFGMRSHFLTFEIFDRELSALRWYHPFRDLREFLYSECNDSQEVIGQELLSLISYFPRNFCLHFLCPTDSDEKHLQQQLKNYEVSLPEQTKFKKGYLSSGFVLSDSHFALIPLTEITKRYKIRRQKQRSTYHSRPSEIHELTTGDLVVHLNAGIGKYLGIERQPDFNNVDSEFFVIEYADNAKMYVPFRQAHLVTKYIGSKEEEKPSLHTLGGKRWKKTKVQTERAIMGYASDLLSLYAERSVRKGYTYPIDSKDVESFEQDFAYHETEDQISAILDVKKDMLSEKPMDRLICGDVGYGKTEVAMRTAFKAVVDGNKQVAVLVPTTVLAMQHYETFLERMWNFPVRVELLSRFLPYKKTKEVLEKVANGAVDILIGTHRIISKDLKYKNLGLVIVDEEQRFGVRTKEYLKTVKSTVDCLTLSATPIPRTLYMSLLGVRDMSTISTPPQDRLPIKTIICESDDVVIKNALFRELARDGQAYIIHNRVESIYLIVEKIRKLFPQARIVVAHGQMSSKDLDEMFHKFKSGKADILIATTIVENGVDIPNANTILVDRADTFGLADLYQLRGRVGRWNRRAYAYFLTPKRRVISPVASKRLQALVEGGCGSGGGMKVAMRDLEIRGAGNLLGTEQSGSVSSIGFHFYCKLLKRTIETLQGKLPSSICDTKMEFVQDARLPEDYINATSLRLEVYQKLGEAFSWEEVDKILEEIKDRFGKFPEPVLWLYHLTRVRVFASLHHITALKISNFSISVERKEKGKIVTKKFLLKTVASPEDLESKVLAALKKGFCLT